MAAALLYSLGWVTGLLFFATEPHNKFVRFHAMQAMLVFGPACAAPPCLSIPFLGWILSIFIFYGFRGPMSSSRGALQASAHCGPKTESDTMAPHMTTAVSDSVLDALRGVRLIRIQPRNFVTLKFIKNLNIYGGRVRVHHRADHAACPVKDHMRD